MLNIRASRSQDCRKILQGRDPAGERLRGRATAAGLKSTVKSYDMLRRG